MAGVQKGLLICVLYNDTANSLDCLMSNVWLMGDELMGGKELLFLLATNQKVRVRFPMVSLEIFIDITLPAGQRYLG